MSNPKSSHEGYSCHVISNHVTDKVKRKAQEIAKPEMSEKGKRQGSYTVCDRYSKLDELDEARKRRVHEGMVFLAEYPCLLVISR